MTKLTSRHKSRFFRRFAKANEAVSALEYAILVGVVAVAVGLALVAFSGKITTAMTNLSAGIVANPTTGPLGSPAPF